MMNFYCVIDTSAFIWDRQRFQENAAPYYQLATELMTFFDCLDSEKPKILMRSTLQEEMVNGFPCELIEGIPDFHELSTAIYSFLGCYAHGVLDFDGIELEGVKSDPDIVYNFYNPTVKKETIYLISYIHQERTDSIYFTFQPIWTKQEKLKTKHGNEPKEHSTIISTEAELKKFFDQFKLVFQHNPKHNKLLGWRTYDGVDIAPLSCDNGQAVNEYAQTLLSTAIRSATKSGLFNYDDVNETFVHFREHEPNRFHAYDERVNDIPKDVRNHFHK